MEFTNSSVWNPLSYLSDEKVTTFLDLEEMFLLGRRTAQIALQEGVELTGSGTKVTGREVGDDRVDLCASPDPLCATLVVQEDVIKMVTSPEDTSIRKRSWNFCEVTSGPLTDPHQGYDHVRKNGDFTNLGYNDSVILRIILDVQKGEGEEHSSTQPGKMSMLSSRLATPRRDNRGIWMIASLFQDAMLCTHKASEPKYLPPVMGGTGATALFDNPNNVFLYVLAYKGGAYRRIYATACAEMQDYLYKLERGIQSAPVLCPRLREKQEYFWGTYDNLVFVPKADNVLNIEQPPKPLYVATGGQNRYQNFENRLMRTRHVVTRRQAQVAWAHTQRLRSIFQGLFPSMKVYSEIDKERSRTARARYDNALSANTALQNLLKREAGKEDAIKMMGSPNFFTLTVGRRDFTRSDAEWVYLNGQGENFSLHDVSLSEDIFVRDEVSSEETFKVAGINLRPYFSHGEELRPTRIKVGLYQINSTQEEWSENLLCRLRAARDLKGSPLLPDEMGPICDQDPEWVNDDTGLIARCLRDVSGTKSRYTVCLVSGDRRLANKMAETCNVSVIRIHPKQILGVLKQRGLVASSTLDVTFLSEYGIDSDYYYVDTGSLAAASVEVVEEDGIMYHRVLLDTGWQEGSRYSKVTLTKVRELRVRKELHKPVQRPKIWRSGSRPYESAYSSHSSWRQSRTGSGSDSAWWRRTDPTPPNNRVVPHYSGSDLTRTGD
jgi:hypothetical protein